jgi:predicted nuclease of predicted toxin-antitoxin system
MRFLVDAQLPPGLCGWLEARGYQAEHVHSLGLGAASDVEIARRAEAEGAILISKDEDFLTLRLPQRFLCCGCGAET